MYNKTRSTYYDGVMGPEEQPSDVGTRTLQFIADRCEYDKYTGCWNWKLATDKNGYGKTNIDDGTASGKSVRAHRLAYRLYYLAWPDVACHKCNNPSCCSPTHIYSGSAVDNAADAMRAKQEQKERNLLAKLREKYG